MLIYYLMFIGSTILGQVNSAYLYKKYQVTAGTSLNANVLYMMINGVVSAIVPACVLLVTGGKMQATPYSLICATATVVCAAISLIFMLKAYELGQVAIVNILVTVGGIIIPCIWGVLFLGEHLSVKGFMAILLMLASVVLIMGKGKGDANKKLIWLYGIIIAASCLTTMIGKMHQVEQTHATVDTYSYSIWIGVIRTILFAMFLPFLIKRDGKEALHYKKAPVVYATLSSVISGGCYIVTLFTAAVLPVVITSPLGTGISILMSSFLPWIAYHEKLSRRQFAGVALSFIGVIIYLINI